MPDITLEIRRIPRPGKRMEVVQSVITAMKNTGRRGVITGSVMTPHSGDQDVVSALMVSSWDELEEMHDGLLASEDRLKEQSAIAELCSKTTIQALNVLARGDYYDRGNVPKYMRRNFLWLKEVNQLLSLKHFSNGVRLSPRVVVQRFSDRSQVL